MADKNLGKRLDGRYLLEEVIGVGGMATVYKAKDITENREVAVKVLKDEYAENEEYKVGVYKINLQKKNSIGIGVGRMDGKTYIPIAYERMYAKNKAIEVQINLTPGEKKKVAGGQIMHKWYF